MSEVISLILHKGQALSFHIYEEEEEQQHVSVIVLDKWNNIDDYIKHHSDDNADTPCIHAYYYRPSLFILNMHPSIYGNDDHTIRRYESSIADPIIYQVLVGNKKAILSGTNINIYNKMILTKDLRD